MGCCWKITKKFLTYDGSRALTYKGFNAGEFFYNSSFGNEQLKNLIDFIHMRTIIKDEYLVIIQCHRFENVDVARSLGHTSKKNPASKKLCIPFFNSLTFQK
jgi:hypothetical protein